MSKGAGGKGNGLTLEICDGITEHANRVALKGVFSAFGDVLACWVPPIDRRHVDAASVRFAAAESAECAKVACDQGQVFFQGLPLKVKWRAGGGPRVGNSDIGGTVGGNSPTRPQLRDRSGGRGGRDGDRRGGRDGDRGGRRRSRSRKRDRSRDRNMALENDVQMGGGNQPFNPLADAPQMMMPPQFEMPPDMMMMQMQQQQQPPMGGMSMGAMAGMPGMPSIQAPEPPPPTREEIEAEERRKVEAKARRAAQLKRGPGVAALVQGALKNAQVSTANKKKDDDEVFIEEPKVKEPVKTKAEIEAERRKQEEAESKLRARQEREALEREKEKAKQRAIEIAKEEQRLKDEAEEREARVRQGVEAAKKQQALRENRPVGGLKAMGPANLYGDMPDAGNQPEDDAAEKKRKEELRRQKQNFNLPPEDPGKVVFLDIDGVLRPARAGGFDILSDGKETANPDTSDFFPSAMKALRHIMERTGAIIVLSSEWRRSENLRESLDEVLMNNRIRPNYDFTPVDVEETKSNDPVRSFADRRAREVSEWLKKNEDSVKGWVVLDDINLAIADEDKKSAAKSMAPKLVQTWPLCGLTMGNAKTAVRILNGEMIHKVLVERPKAPGGINTGNQAQAALPPGRI